MKRTVRCLGVAAGTLMVASFAFAVPAQAGGANTTGPYDPFQVGAPSANGNGNGNAYGRPAAGTVGKADVKNPPGQLPGPQDGNNGYECDGNSGVAKGNPAHTGCRGDDEGGGDVGGQG